MERKLAARGAAPAAEEAGAEVVEHEEPDAAEDRFPREDEDYPGVAGEDGDRAGVDAEAGVAEAHRGVEDAAVDVADAQVEERRADSLDGEHRADGPADQPLEALDLGDAVGVHERELAGEREAASDRDEEEGAAGHEAEAADLDEDEQHDLAGAGGLRGDVHHGEAGHADRRAGGEERDHRVAPGAVGAGERGGQHDRADSLEVL